MTKVDYAAKLREGAKAWNTWRRRSPHRHLIIRDRDLSRTDLSHAELAEVTFEACSFEAANLNGVRCLLTHFLGCDLNDVNLRNARLAMTSFESCAMRRCDFAGTNINWCSFSETDLAEAQLLDAIHEAPSSIGIDTLYKSGGLPEEFLRRCGVPEEFIAYADSLVSKPLEYFSCFISYSSQDDAFVRNLYAFLQSKKLRVWFAPEDLKIGDRFHARIEEAIRMHDKLVLVLSKHSVISAWVRREVEAALEREDREKRDIIFPIRVDDSIFDVDEAWARELRRSRHIGDFRESTAFERLAKDLRR